MNTFDCRQKLGKRRLDLNDVSIRRFTGHPNGSELGMK